ncbi:DUF427-domain-containing protein [Crucibulum laeve]|uniref:DUF427-domain-containing protein n=1 Tax=Crucibulum laeve TaxID=68775 RepID=A0A5C3LW01_9AGAR|nr:DUF427-domain-containing protein [Crucibulum laeve]
MSFFPLPHIEDSPKRIRVYIAGVCIVDTRHAKLVWEHAHYPNYFFPEVDLPNWYLSIPTASPDVASYDLWIGLRGAPKTITRYLTGPLAGLFTIKFSDMDAWFEEDEQIYVHPRDPYKRVDVLQSSRHIRIEANGIEIANTRAPRLLFETGLPVRTYIAKTDCRLDLLEPSELTTECPYKGKANYYHVQLESGRFENVVWWYPNTTAECSLIRGYVAFYDEKVDVWVDSEKQEKPGSK